MLFPLSKSFSSTRLFQTGGQHHDPPRRKPCAIDTTGSRERVEELHQLLTERKPYATHLAVIQRRAEEGRKQDVACARLHADQIKSVNAEQDKAAKACRHAMHKDVERYNQARTDNGASKIKEMRGQRDTYVKWREEMEGRVREIPALGKSSGLRPSSSTIDVKEVKRQTAQYFKDMRELKENLKTRPPQDWKVPPRGEPLATLSATADTIRKQHKDYESFLEGLYDSHHKRIRGNRRQLLQEMHEREEADEVTQQKRTETYKAKTASGKQDLEEMLSRVKGRPKGFGGYVPVPKTEKRVRSEGGLKATASAPLLSSPETQATLHPGALGTTA